MWASVCLPEGTVLKRPSNGAAEMKADRVPKGLSVTLSRSSGLRSSLDRHYVTGARRRERGAGVSRSECEHCGLVRARHFPAV